jgi:hypothetical protein
MPFKHRPDCDDDPARIANARRRKAAHLDGTSDERHRDMSVAIGGTVDGRRSRFPVFCSSASGITLAQVFG